MDGEVIGRQVPGRAPASHSSRNERQNNRWGPGRSALGVFRHGADQAGRPEAPIKVTVARLARRASIWSTARSGSRKNSTEPASTSGRQSARTPRPRAARFGKTRIRAGPALAADPVSASVRRPRPEPWHSAESVLGQGLQGTPPPIPAGCRRQCVGRVNPAVRTMSSVRLARSLEGWPARQRPGNRIAP